MKKMKLVKFISIGSILTALTVILQSSPVFLPAIGLAISPFSTAMVAVAAVLNSYLGIAVLFSSAILLISISLQEALILLFTTGLLGALLGIMLYRVKSFLAVVVSAIALTLGMCILTYLADVPGFVKITDYLSLPVILLVFFFFSLIYTGAWRVILYRLVKLLIRLKVIDYPEHDPG